MSHEVETTKLLEMSDWEGQRSLRKLPVAETHELQHEGKEEREEQTVQMKGAV